MPKMKTHKGAKRRFKITAGGKLMMAKGMKSHLRRKRSRRVKQAFDKMHEMFKGDQRRVRTALPYGVK